MLFHAGLFWRRRQKGGSIDMMNVQPSVNTNYGYYHTSIFFRSSIFRFIQMTRFADCREFCALHKPVLGNKYCSTIIDLQIESRHTGPAPRRLEE